MIKAVLFDLDGTLVNSLEDLAQATNRALATENYPPRQTEDFKYFAGDGIPKMIERALPERHKDAETVTRMTERFLAYYANHYADFTCAYDGVPELLAKLKEQGLILAVVTNKRQDMADIVVGKLYGNIFDRVFGMQKGIPAKPDPTMAHIAMKELGVTAEECVFLGDSGMDVATAVNSRALPVGELWGFRGEEELRGNGAKYIITKPCELLPIIEEHNK